MNENTRKQLKRAATVAARAHDGQVRKDGTPYIAHPVRVAIGCDSPYEKIVALLHDVVEDTDITLNELRELGFDAIVLEAVDRVTKRPGERYMDFIERAAAHDVSRRVKIADIEDNLEDQSALDPDEAAFLKERYTKALERLR